MLTTRNDNRTGTQPGKATLNAACERKHGTAQDYTNDNVSTKPVKIIRSYVEIVNKMVRRKY